MRIFVGLIFIVIGAIITIKSERMLSAFGRVGFAEKYLGSSGGSRLFYQLFGVILVLVGFLIATDLLSKILISIFGGLL